jgi:hypothetical protein
MKRRGQMSMSMSSELKWLREALDGCARDAGGRRIYSDELADRAGQYAAARRNSGAGLKAVATELGVWESQVVRWLNRLKGEGFREVSVVVPEPSSVGRVVQTAPGQRPGNLVVTSPRGFRIEGLTISALRELWGGL